MLTENLQIYRDMFELAKLLLIYQPCIPKVVRYGEYGKAISLACEAMDYIYIANSEKVERLWALTRLLQDIGGVRSRVRLLGESRYLSPRQSVNLMHILDKVGRQATGWRNSSKSQSRGATGDTGEQPQ